MTARRRSWVALPPHPYHVDAPKRGIDWPLVAFVTLIAALAIFDVAQASIWWWGRP